MSKRTTSTKKKIIKVLLGLLLTLLIIIVAAGGTAFLYINVKIGKRNKVDIDETQLREYENLE